MNKILLFTLILVTGLAPTVSAYPAADMCGMAKKGTCHIAKAQRSCCGTGCKCVIETRSEDPSSAVTVSVPSFVETSADFMAAPQLALIAGHTPRIFSDVSPPSDTPLYLLHSAILV